MSDPSKPPNISDEEWEKIKDKVDDPKAFDGAGTPPYPLLDKDKESKNG